MTYNITMPAYTQHKYIVRILVICSLLFLGFKGTGCEYESVQVVLIMSSPFGRYTKIPLWMPTRHTLGIAWHVSSSPMLYNP